MLCRALLVLLLASPAVADTISTAPASRPAADAPKREGEYGGVTPGEAPAGPGTGAARPRRLPHTGTLHWIGFEAKDGGAELFFQSAAAFDVEQHLEGSTLIVHLALVRLGANAWRTLDTRFFDNPLAGATARVVSPRRASRTAPARTRGIDVRIAFKNAADARAGTVRTATEADGRFYAYLTFPEGAEPTATP